MQQRESKEKIVLTFTERWTFYQTSRWQKKHLLPALINHDFRLPTLRVVLQYPLFIGMDISIISKSGIQTVIQNTSVIMETK
jgi:hypothetical protein